MTDEQKIDALLPCPFCGGVNLSNQYNDGLYWIRCEGCGATGPACRKRQGDTPSWNTRQAPSSDTLSQANFLLGIEGSLIFARAALYNNWHEEALRHINQAVEEIRKVK
jgi:hypothetical protein